MEAMFHASNWGSPVGIGLFLLFLFVGMGVFFWGISRLSDSKTKERISRLSESKKKDWRATI